jgi:hypothetical protein
MNGTPRCAKRIGQFEFMVLVSSMGLLAVRHGMGVLTLPFDAARAQYARNVQAGLLPRSLLASRDFERTLGVLEQIALGPLARHV